LVHLAVVWLGLFRRGLAGIHYWCGVRERLGGGKSHFQGASVGLPLSLWTSFVHQFPATIRQTNVLHGTRSMKISSYHKYFLVENIKHNEHLHYANFTTV
jgi:hypothetical protein